MTRRHRAYIQPCYFKDDQIKLVERTKMTPKKRKGVAQFVRFFPVCIRRLCFGVSLLKVLRKVYVQRMEVQLIGANALEIRGNMDAAYERIVDAMFDVLQQMAKLEGEGEDKDKSQLNYHVVLIGKGGDLDSICGNSSRVTNSENMHSLVVEFSQLELGAMGSFARRAQIMYDENISAYVKIVLRRPFSKILVSRP